MVQKTAWRYMQFNPDLYPVNDFKFVPSSSLGIIAREYEVTQLVQLLQTMQPDSPMYPMLIESIVDNMNLSNREEMIARLQQANQPNPEAQQIQQMQLQVQMAKEQATAAALEAQAAEANARAQKYAMETQYTGYDSETNRIKAVTTNLEKGTEDDKEFERRLKVAEVMLKEKQLGMKATQTPEPSMNVQQPMGELDANPNRNEEYNQSNQRDFQQTGQAS